MEQRNRGIDLLRMTAMWMVVILHILNKGGVLAAAAPLSAGQGTARLLETAAYCAVNCYGLISGYVGVQRRFRYSGALALWLRVAFYTLGITAVFACLMPGSVNGDRVLRAFFPVLFRQYWYVTAYFGMCLFIPFFNLLLNRLSKGQLRLLALSIVLVFSVLPTLRQKDVFLTDNGYSVLWLSCLYLLGGILRLCGRQTSRRPAYRGAIYAGCVLATWLVRLAGDRLWMARTGHLCDKVLLTAYTLAHRSAGGGGAGTVLRSAEYRPPFWAFYRKRLAAGLQRVPDPRPSADLGALAGGAVRVSGGQAADSAGIRRSVRRVCHLPRLLSGGCPAGRLIPLVPCQSVFPVGGGSRIGPAPPLAG